MTTRDDKALSRGFSTEMSAEAILQRLQIVDELYQLGRFLESARWIGKVEDLQRESASPNETNGD